jgi:hypothetical protein
MSLLRLAIPHAVGAATATGSACLLTALAYVLLLFLGLANGTGPGGPLALPFLLASALLGVAASSIFVFLPAVCVARRAARRRLRRWLWQPIVGAAVVATASALAVLVWATTIEQKTHTLTAWLVLCGLQLPLLGIYWPAVSVTEWVLASWLGDDAHVQRSP